MWVALIGLMCIEGKQKCEWAVLDSGPLFTTKQQCEAEAELMTTNLVRHLGGTVLYIDMRCTQIKEA